MPAVGNASAGRASVGASSESDKAARARDGGVEAKTESRRGAGAPAARVSLSEEARAASSTSGSPSGSQELTPEEEAQVEELKQRDAEVRTHEQAHVAAAGGYAKGGIHYDFQRGPDNRQYAVGGHVNIDSSPIAGDPEATLRKAEVVKRAALAPKDPSAQDRRVASKADQTAAKARMEIAEAKRNGDDDTNEASAVERQDARGEVPASDARDTRVRGHERGEEGHRAEREDKGRDGERSESPRQDSQPSRMVRRALAQYAQVAA